jgi:hypothetical protein
MKRLVHLPLILLPAILGCAGEEEDPLAHLLNGGGPEEAPEVEAGSGTAEVDYAELYGPGRIVEEDPYSTVTPNGAWLNRSLGGNLFLVRRADPADDSELGYVEAYRLPDLPDRTARALATGGDLPRALAEDLRVLVKNGAEEPVAAGEDPAGLDGYPSAAAAYYDLKRNSLGERERAYNEVTLLLVGHEAHVLAGYCFADARETFVPELRAIAENFAVEPPPPPPPPPEEGADAAGGGE